MPFASFFFLSRRVGDATAKNKKKKRLDYDEQSTITHTHCIGAHRRRRRRRRHHASRGTLKGARAWAIIKTALATRRRRDFRTWLHIPPPPPYPPHRLLTCDAIGREGGGGGNEPIFLGVWLYWPRTPHRASPRHGRRRTAPSHSLIQIVNVSAVMAVQWHNGSIGIVC